MLIKPVTSFVTLIYYYLFYCILARLCEAAGAGCLSENVFETADCDAFEENGWDGVHIVAGLNVTRPALITDGYADQAGDAFKVLPVCAEATRKCFRTWPYKDKQ